MTTITTVDIDTVTAESCAPVENYARRAFRYWRDGVAPHSPEHDCLTCADGREWMYRWGRRTPPAALRRAS